MATPTYEEYVKADYIQLETWLESADQDTADQAEEHLNYRDAVISWAASGGGSNPPSPPPPPPGH